MALITLLVQIGLFVLTAASAVAEPGPNGIDFWANDRLHLPDYGASTNLILNPSFEAGFRYWGYPLFVQSAIPLQYQNIYELDDNEAHSGSHSLRIKALPFRCPLPLGFFTVPYVAGANYTLSFYAKGSSAENLVVNLWGASCNTTISFLKVPQRLP